MVCQFFGFCPRWNPWIFWTSPNCYFIPIPANLAWKMNYVFLRQSIQRIRNPTLVFSSVILSFFYFSLQILHNQLHLNQAWSFLSAMVWHVTSCLKTRRGWLWCRILTFIYAFVNVTLRLQYQVGRKQQVWYLCNYLGDIWTILCDGCNLLINVFSINLVHSYVIRIFFGYNQVVHALEIWIFSLKWRSLQIQSSFMG